MSRSKERAGECRLYRTKAEVFERQRVVVVVFNPKTFARQKEIFNVLLYNGPRTVRKMAKMSSVQSRLWEVLELAKYHNTG